MMSASRPTADPYADIVPYYDLEHADFRADVDLLLSFADIVGGPILEMGCGSGRVLLPIAEAGFDVTGLDCSAPMLDRCRDEAARRGLNDRVTLFTGDMANAEAAPGGPFGLVIFSLNGLMHLTSSAAQRAALASARRALDPKGQLIIDVINPSLAVLQELIGHAQLEGSWRLDDGTAVDKWSWRRLAEDDQVLETTLWYDLFMADGSSRRLRSAFDLRFIHQSELLLMLELAGFVEPHVYGTYDLDPWYTDADRLLVTAEVTPSARGR